MKTDFQNDRLLRDAFSLYHTLLCQYLPSQDELRSIPLSEKFQKRMERLIHQQKKFYYHWINTAAKRVACILLLLALAATTVTFSVEALREPFLRFVVETFEKGSRLIFPADSAEDQPIEPMLPAYIPDGFSLNLDMSDQFSVFLLYKNADGKEISFMQQSTNGTTIGLNTEGITPKKIMILHTYEGLIFTHEEEANLTFSTDEYVFNLTGTLSEEELLKIAESIPLK